MRMRRVPGRSALRALLLVTVLALSAGAVAPASADDDDNGDNGGGQLANYNPCFGGTPSNTTLDVPLVGTFFVQTCTITASSGRCVQRSSAPLLIQQCFVNQGPTIAAGMPISNNLIVDQLADQRGAEGLLDATQIVDGPPGFTRGEQRTFGTAGNSADIEQRIIQKLAAGIDDDNDGEDDDDNGEVDEDDDGEEDDDNGETHGDPAILDEINQFEQTHQWVDLCQGGAPTCEDFAALTGRNKSIVVQSAESFELAANALEINQFQSTVAKENTCSDGPDSAQDDIDARMCYTINQYTSNASQNRDRPANYSDLSQYNNQVQFARNAGDGRQAKGFSFDEGGLDHSFVQFTPPPGATAGIALLVSDQDEYQSQRKVNSPLMTQGQFGNIRKGSGMQASNPKSLTDLVLDKTQYQGEGPFQGQTGSARAFATTTGECVADLTVTQNGESGHAEEPPLSSDPDAATPGDVCSEFVVCGDFGEFTEEFPPPPSGEVCSTSDPVVT